MKLNPITMVMEMKNVNDRSKCNKRLSKRSAEIESDWKRYALNRFDDGDD